MCFLDNLYSNTRKSIDHIKILHDVFNSEKHPIYVENYGNLTNSLKFNNNLFEKQLYGSNGRQMILADIIEYIFIGRGYYFVTSGKNKDNSSLSEYMKIIFYLA